MVFELFIKGIIIGISIAAPVGPIGVLCIRRTLEYGKFIGFISGLGAATADGLYGMIAGLGLTVVTNFLVEQQGWIHFIGGVFLLYLGLKIFISKPLKTSAKANGNTVFGAYTSTFFLTITNPVTILSFLAIFSGLGISNPNDDTMTELAVVLGVFLGSTLWWLTLSSVTGILKNRIKNFPFNIVNRVSGLIILMFGLWSMYNLSKGFFS
ncbi:lysine transporter LysE [Bacillus sp. AFS054943]|uniref:LysE family translocator n=1 Tax=unclassified Bacillus (in: firmicutes) TaxID=185979 RepID=UPI000BF92827|nr:MULTISPECIES: LysE family transporter [unclassified Bacillus (in: firmicutes)]PFA65584.1 lysine transporter LysE [Bacillus sp. AFS015896]PGL79980.1 lysine transporter LysE [Bacillus sp. AFS054943]PGZ74834.1 lysine transporter LysE [Bacillus sp. AFS029637]